MKDLIPKNYEKLENIIAGIYKIDIVRILNVDINVRLDGTGSLLICMANHYSDKELLQKAVVNIYGRIAELLEAAEFTEVKDNTGFNITRRRKSGRNTLSLFTNFEL
jgi:hypothetical protein